MSEPLGRYLLYGATLALAWFAIVSAFATTIVALWTRRVMARLEHAPSAVWFALRVLPGAAAALFVAAIFLPSYWLFEPRDAGEAFNVTLLALAGLAVGALVAAGLRGVAAWHRAALRTRTWMRTARPLALPGTQVPAFELDADAPLLALAGIVRPRLLVTRGLLAALTPEELAACVAHELAHSRSHDNLKRLAMRLMPDVLPFTTAAGVLERRWASSAEHRADRHASAGDAQARWALASALLKVARLTPLTPITEPISALVGGADLASRVSRLLDERPRARRATGAAIWIAAGAAALAATAWVYTPLLYSVHRATELLLRSLP